MVRILMIEDNAVDRKAFERFVTSGDFSFSCTFAGSLKAGMDKISESPFDVILVDYQLGDGTAFDLLNFHNKTPIVVITGMGNEEIAIQAMKKGACDYLIKDVNSSYLKIIPVTIENVIQRWKNSQLQKLLSHTVRSISEGVFITDKSDRIIFVNNAFSTIYGYSEMEICGKESVVIWQNDRDDQQSLDFVMHQTNVDWMGKVVHKRKNGDLFYASMSRSAVRDDNDEIFAVVAIVRDTSEQTAINQQQEQLLVNILSTLNRFKQRGLALPVNCEAGTLEDIQQYWRQLEKFLESVDDQKHSTDTPANPVIERADHQ